MNPYRVPVFPMTTWWSGLTRCSQDAFSFERRGFESLCGYSVFAKSIDFGPLRYYISFLHPTIPALAGQVG